MFLVCGGGGVRIAFGPSNNLYVDITLLVSRGKLSSFHTLLSVKNFLARLDFFFIFDFKCSESRQFLRFFSVSFNQQAVYSLYVYVCINVSIYASLFSEKPVFSSFSFYSYLLSLIFIELKLFWNIYPSLL